MSPHPDPPIPTRGFYRADCHAGDWTGDDVGLRLVADHHEQTGHEVAVRTLIGPASGHEAEWARRYGRGGAR